MIEVLLRRIAGLLGGEGSANARALACVWGFGASCLTATILLPHPAGAYEPGLALVVVIAYPVAALLYVRAETLPPVALEACTYLGQLLITALTLFWGAPDAPYLWFHVWLVVHAFHFLAPVRATLQIGCAAALFVFATLATQAPFPGAASVVGVGSIVLVGLLVGALRVQVDALLDELARSAATDPLTGLANRRAFGDAYALAEARRARAGTWGALLLLDCDRFKSINDRHGHAAGDRSLRRLAIIIAANIRDVDLAARLGGDEFAVLLDATERGAAAVIGERIRQALTDGRDATAMTVSIGIVELAPGMAVDLQAALAAADRAMYESKARGGDSVTIGEHGRTPPQTSASRQVSAPA